MEQRLNIGDIILYHSKGEADSSFNGKYGKVISLEEETDITCLTLTKVLVRFDTPKGGVEIRMPNDFFENYKDYAEVVYHAEIDFIVNGASEEEVDKWLNEYPFAEQPTQEEFEQVLKEGDKRFDDAMTELHGEVSEAVNPDYASPEDAAEDIFTDITAQRLKTLRDKYSIPKPDKDTVELLEKVEQEG